MIRMNRFIPLHHQRTGLKACIDRLAGFGLVLALLGLCSCATLTENGPSAPSTAETPSSALSSPLTFFRKYISSADGDRCPMHPSCSTYSSEAFKKHGPVLGWIMTTDRLMRCGRDELDRSPRIQKNDRSYCYDPVAENDFWW